LFFFLSLFNLPRTVDVIWSLPPLLSLSLSPDQKERRGHDAVNIKKNTIPISMYNVVSCLSYVRLLRVNIRLLDSHHHHL
jgi:hypothetical protein